MPQEKLVGRRTGCRNERAIAMELMHRYGGASQPEIGKVMGDLDYTAVSRERKRLREKIKTERGLKAALDEIGTSLMSSVKDLTWTPLCPNTCIEVTRLREIISTEVRRLPYFPSPGRIRLSG